MSLILLKQTPTGIYWTTPEIPENEIFQTWYFSTFTKEVTNLNVNGGNSFELMDNQLVWTDPSNGDQYFYDPLGPAVILVEGEGPAPDTTYTLSILVSPSNSGTASDDTDEGPYPAGAEIELSAVPASGWSFVSWTVNGDTLSESASFTFTMPPAKTLISANFEQTVTPEPEPPKPPVLPSDFVAPSYYPLELRINGVQIPITTLTEKRDTGIFKDGLIGEYSYPLTIPITEAVMVALGLPNDPQSAWEYVDAVPAELWAHGNRRYRGHLDILDADEKSIKATFVFDSGFFINQNKALSIQQCYPENDTIVLNELISAVGGYELRFNFRDLRLSVNGTARLFLKVQYESHLEMLEAMADYLESLPLNLEVSIQYSEDLTDESSRIITWDTNIVTTITLAPTTGTSRFTRARRLTNERFNMDSWKSVNPQNRIAFPMLYNKELYESNNVLHDGIVNRYDSQGRMYFGNIVYFAVSEAFRWENVIVPYIYLVDVVRTIFAHLNIQVSGSFFEDDRVKRMLLYNNRTLDFMQVSENGIPTRRTVNALYAGDENPEQEFFRYQNVHNFNIRLRNHVPDVSVIDFLKAMKNYFFLKYDFNILQNRVEIRFIRDVIRDMQVLDFTRRSGRVYKLTMNKERGLAITYENPDPILQDGNTDLPKDFQPDYNVTNYLALHGLDAEIDEIAFVKSLRAYFRLTPDQNNPPFWKLYTFQMKDDKQENLRSWSVGMVPLVDAFVDGRKMPAIEMTANQPEINLFNKDTGIRIMAFYGEQHDAQNRPYHFASATRFNAKEVAAADQYDLDLKSEDMYPWWKDLESIIDCGKPYETNLIVSDVDLVDLSNTRRIRIANIDYLIDEMEILNTQGEFAIAKVTMWKVKS
jgi:hypothetical protein